MSINIILLLRFLLPIMKNELQTLAKIISPLWLKLHNSWNQALIELENCQILSGILLLRPSTEGLNSYRQPSFRFYLYIISSPAPTIKLQSFPVIIDVLEFRLTKERIETQTPDQFYPLLIRHLWPELWASEPFAQGIRKRHLGIQKRR